MKTDERMDLELAIVGVSQDVGRLADTIGRHHNLLTAFDLRLLHEAAVALTTIVEVAEQKVAAE